MKGSRMVCLDSLISIKCDGNETVYVLNCVCIPKCVLRYSREILKNFK